MIHDDLFKQIEKIRLEYSKKSESVAFPSYRAYPYLNLYREENNFFYSVLTLSTLKRNYPKVEYATQRKITRAIDQAIKNFGPYRVIRDEVPLYQFWPDLPNAHFPNGHILHRFKKFKSPPDADDTALGYLVYPHSKQDMLNWQSYLIQFANGATKQNQKLPKKFRMEKVYGTWMGTGAMPIEFDTVVMTNILTAMSDYQVVLDECGLATLAFLKKIIKSAYYLKEPFNCAPWYPSPFIIHYHLVRFFTDHPDFLELSIKRNLEDQQLQLVKMKQHPMESLLLCSSALRLGTSIDRISFESIEALKFESFTFYVGGMLTATSGKLLWYLARYPIFHWRFKCPAFYLALAWEYHLLQKKN